LRLPLKHDLQDLALQIERQRLGHIVAFTISSLRGIPFLCATLSFK